MHGTDAGLARQRHLLRRRGLHERLLHDAGQEGHALHGDRAVALGKMKDFTKITYGLAAPPTGFDSCHGVRNTPKTSIRSSTTMNT